MFSIRTATPADVPHITHIYNQGIEDGIATLEYPLKSEGDMRVWFDDHGERYPVIIATWGDEVVGWAALNPYSHRCAYDGVADLSIYVRRDQRGDGLGQLLMQEIERRAVLHGFHKIVLFALTANGDGRRLYDRRGFREVGIFREQGKLNGKYVDVLVMEKLVKNT